MTSTPGDDNEVLTIVPEAEHISAIRLRDEARVGSHTHRSPRKLPRIYTGLFLLGFCWTFLQLALGIHSVEFSSGFETVSVAKRIAATGEFADPFMTPTGPTAHVAPVYPFVMGIAYRYFNLLGAGLLMTTLNAALLGLEMCLVAVLSLRTFGSIRPGVFGAVLLGAGTRLVPQHDALFSGVLLLAAGMALLWNNSARAGIWAGLSVLTNPVSALAVGVLALFRGWRFALLAGIVALAICAPWVVRNWAVLGYPYFVRDNFGLELALSNFDDADAQLIVNPGLWKLHPSRNPTEAKTMATLGEPVYYRKQLHAAVVWIQTHPRQFLELCAQRVFYYWLPPLREGWPAGIRCILFLLAAIGTWLSLANRQAAALALTTLAYSLPYAFVQVDLRYSIPTMWALALLAGYALHELLYKFLPEFKWGTQLR